MSSGFISETEIAKRKKLRQEEWDKVRKPDEPVEAPEEEYDHRSLYDRLQEQKQKKDLEYEEAHRLKNMIKGLDDDEVEFLDLVDRSKLEEEKKKNAEEAQEIKSFREAVATLEEKSLEQRINNEIRTKPVINSSGRSSQVKLLAGAVVKRKSIPDVKIAENGLTKNLAEGDQPQAASLVNGNECDSKKRKLEEKEETVRQSQEEQQRSSPKRYSNLRCIGILPGMGSYPDSSDSEQSSDSEVELSSKTPGTDILGRKIVLVRKKIDAEGGKVVVEQR